MDATPIRVGQVFSGYAAQAQYCDRFAPAARSSGSKKTCRSAARPSARASTRIRKFAAKVCVALSQQARRHVHRSGQSSRSPSGERFVRRSPRRTENDRRFALQNRQRHPPARLRPALQHLRTFAAGHATRLLDHAGQSEPGHRRVGDSSRLPRAGQRRRRHHGRPSAASARCSS